MNPYVSLPVGLLIVKRGLENLVILALSAKICVPIGFIVLDKLVICTHEAEPTDRKEEGMILHLVGEEMRDGTPKCDTSKLNRWWEQTFVPGKCDEFGSKMDKDLCGGCYKYPLMGDLDESTTIEWLGNGEWSGTICATWMPKRYLHVRCEVENGVVTDCDEVCDCYSMSTTKCEDRASAKSEKNRGGLLGYLN